MLLLVALSVSSLPLCKGAHNAQFAKWSQGSALMLGEFSEFSGKSDGKGVSIPGQCLSPPSLEVFAVNGSYQHCLLLVYL